MTFILDKSKEEVEVPIGGAMYGYRIERVVLTGKDVLKLYEVDPQKTHQLLGDLLCRFTPQAISS